MEVFRHQTFVKRWKWIETNQITISSCSVYLSGEYYTMDQALLSQLALTNGIPRHLKDTFWNNNQSIIRSSALYKKYLNSMSKTKHICLNLHADPWRPCIYSHPDGRCYHQLESGQLRSSHFTCIITMRLDGCEKREWSIINISQFKILYQINIDRSQLWRQWPMYCTP